MSTALHPANPMPVLLSDAYLDPARFTTDEWTAKPAQRRHDPSAKLIPLRIGPVSLHGGCGAPIVVPDLCGLPRSRLGPGGRLAGRSGPFRAPGLPGWGPAAGTDGPWPPGYLPPVWNLARPNPGFTGRDDVLNRLHDALAEGGRAAVAALERV